MEHHNWQTDVLPDDQHKQIAGNNRDGSFATVIDRERSIGREEATILTPNARNAVSLAITLAKMTPAQCKTNGKKEMRRLCDLALHELRTYVKGKKGAGQLIMQVTRMRKEFD